MVNISAQKSEERSSESNIYNRREYSYSTFTRSFTLAESADADKIQASYTERVIKLSLPKNEEARAVSRQIEIR